MPSTPAELLAVACPDCHAALAVAAPLFGQPAACPVCGAGFLVPSPPEAPPLAAASAPLTGLAPGEPAVGTEEPVFASIDTSEPPPKAIGHGSERIELSRLTPEEKATRRAHRTLITLGLGTLFLFVIVLVATRGGKKPRGKR